MTSDQQPSSSCSLSTNMKETKQQRRTIEGTMKARIERLYDILEQAQLYIRTATTGTTIKRVAYEDSQSKRQEDDYLVRLWRKLSVLVNGVTFLPIEVDCITGAGSPQWTKIIPAWEGWIPEDMYWLRASGVLDVHGGNLERWTKSLGNSVPLTSWMARNIEYEVGGLILLPTKKCLWRMCMIGIDNLIHRAECRWEGREAFRHFNPRDLLQGWIEHVGSIRYSFFAIGRNYFKEFKDDYSRKERRIDNSPDDDEDNAKAEYCQVAKTPKVLTGVERYPGYDRIADRIAKEKDVVPIYEYHWIVTKPRVESGVDYINRPIKVDGEASLEVLTWTRVVHPDGRQRIPPKTTQRQFPVVHPETEAGMGGNVVNPPQKKEGGLASVGPTLFVPFDPVPTIKHFDGTIRRLLREENYYIEEDSEMQQIMDLAELFLRLAQCGTPADLWKIPIPKWLGGVDGLPKKPENINTVQRFHFNETELQAHLTLLEELRRVRKEYDALMSNITIALQCSEAGTSTLHIPDQFALYGLELEAGISSLQAQIKFEKAVVNHGHYEALDRLRLHKGGLGRDSETFARLVSETKLIKEGVKIGCKGYCFEEIRGDIISFGESGVDDVEAIPTEQACCHDLRAPLVREVATGYRIEAWIASLKHADIPRRLDERGPGDVRAGTKDDERLSRIFRQARLRNLRIRKGKGKARQAEIGT